MYIGNRTNDPAGDYDRWCESEPDAPLCELCGEPVGDYFYRVFETLCCEECIRGMRRSTDMLRR